MCHAGDTVYLVVTRQEGFMDLKIGKQSLYILEENYE